MGFQKNCKSKSYANAKEVISFTNWMAFRASPIASVRTQKYLSYQMLEFK
jgi:hypothetical protein